MKAKSTQSTFGEVLQHSIDAAASRGINPEPGFCRTASGSMCSLCYAASMRYEDELLSKESALRSFLKNDNLDSLLKPLVASPRGRGYRTVSKRRVLTMRQGPMLVLLSPDETGRHAPLPVEACAIEPKAHASIYTAIQHAIGRPHLFALAEQLQHVIIKGDYLEYTVIFNVREITGPVTKAANVLSKTLTRNVPAVQGVFLFEGEPGGYYMGTHSPGEQPLLRRLHGKETIHQNVRGKHFLFSPRSFSQVNQSIVTSMVTSAAEALELTGKETLFDLYCGYGLFAVSLAERSRRVVGLDLSPSSVSAARTNAERNRITTARFYRNDITPESLERNFSQARPTDVAILDPPRSGTGNGVIEHVASRHFRTIAHFFCNIEILPTELRRWNAGGYTIARLIPFDVFPGTASVEVMAVLHDPEFPRRRNQESHSDANP